MSHRILCQDSTQELKNYDRGRIPKPVRQKSASEAKSQSDDENVMKDGSWRVEKLQLYPSTISLSSRDCTSKDVQLSFLPCSLFDASSLDSRY